MKMADEIAQNRWFMKSRFATAQAYRSDQSQGVAVPPLQKPVPSGARVVALPKSDTCQLAQRDILTCLRERRSRRRFSEQEMTLPDLSFLLWATQGIEDVLAGGLASLRPAPSAGARHPFETYLVANRVSDLDPGVYRYLPVDHQLVFEFTDPALHSKVTAAALGQEFVADAAVVFFWSCIPYRGEWRYTVLSHKVMLIDVGHVCQNLYLACEAIGCGTCGIGAYDQEAADRLLQLDGEDEFVVYLAPVGKKAPR